MFSVSRIKYEEEMKKEEDEEERTTMCFGINKNDRNEKLESFLWIALLNKQINKAEERKKI